MPGDTLIVLNTGDTVRMQDSVFHLATVTGKHVVNDADTLEKFFPVWLPVIIIILAFGRPFFAGLLGKYRRRRIQEDALKELDTNYMQYDNWLSTYNVYYKSLSPSLRQRFLQRVTEFKESKEFNYIGIEPDDKMPLLISAAAIQITFGLDKYLLDFFDTIHVLKSDYRYGLYNVPFMGHVNKEGIYLSWDNFMKGYENYGDANNVGIHEMAHALAYVNFMAGENDGEDDEFKERFRRFSLVARPIFNDMQNGASNLLDSYAASNYNEFWAVGVETFFEKSLHMKVEMPQLYSAMCVLLNQDPASEEKILPVQLA